MCFNDPHADQILYTADAENPIDPAFMEPSPKEWDGQFGNQTNKTEVELPAGVRFFLIREVFNRRGGRFVKWLSWKVAVVIYFARRFLKRG